MALSRRRRDEGNIWAGFVDAVTTLLMVLMFVLTIFTVMQTMLRDTITTQDNQLTALNAQVAQLASALGLEQTKSADLTSGWFLNEKILPDCSTTNSRSLPGALAMSRQFSNLRAGKARSVT